ncbi:hypothetical protein CCACVL1_04252 [Corchorus capsularis]|uniref:Uncharacterized protein n=1 Tax=Corchorus capsularis TaxID=210143 RepID=A0A1R3JU15_COCAP|nr:hypothetical protein CCACVL1_04252 [Corchorus capsularis]
MANPITLSLQENKNTNLEKQQIKRKQEIDAKEKRRPRKGTVSKSKKTQRKRAKDTVRHRNYKTEKIQDESLRNEKKQSEEDEETMDKP